MTDHLGRIASLEGELEATRQRLSRLESVAKNAADLIENYSDMPRLAATVRSQISGAVSS